MLYRKWALAFLLSAMVPVTVLADKKSDAGPTEGALDLKHAGSLSFAPNGVLLVGDSINATVYAIETGDSQAVSDIKSVNIEKINEKIAAMIGVNADEASINDIAVNPLSGNVYISVSRGKGPGATPLLFKADSKGAISEVSLKNANYTKATFANAPESKEGQRGNPRMQAITDIQYNQGKVIVAGLSNEEFASKLRVFNYPFDGKEKSTSIEVYHGAHGKLETASPVRTFITYENAVLAAYTCTPLVNIPVDDLNGSKIRGKTIAELGNRNNPLDMIVYKKGDQDFLLMANSARGVMKLKLSKQQIDGAKHIDTRIDGTAGVPYETLKDLQGVLQLDKLNADHAVLLVSNQASQDLRTIDLP